MQFKALSRQSWFCGVMVKAVGKWLRYPGLLSQFYQIFFCPNHLIRQRILKKVAKALLSEIRPLRTMQQRSHCRNMWTALKYHPKFFCLWTELKQVCIPVGCLPPACWPYPVVSRRGVSLEGECLSRGVCVSGGVCIPACNGVDTPLPMTRITDV